MKAFARIPLVLAAAILVAQPALACCCVEDVAAHAQEPVAGVPSCHESGDAGQTDAKQSASARCSDCADYQPAPAGDALRGIASGKQPEFEPPAPIADNSAPSLRPQTVRVIGPPAAVPRQAQTPVLLKQRLLN